MRCSLIIALLVCAPALDAAERSPSLRNYTNPIIAGFNPDPTICRVGEDYYLATSSFEYFPGVPLYHSRDLVHWEQLGHVLTRPAQLNLTGIECSGGIYAPTLRYHAGIFYLITTLVGAGEKKGNFIVTATDPGGPWSDPHWIEGARGIDPSLFFDDDGRVYYCGNDRPKKMVSEKHRVIWIQELDLKTWKLTGPRGELDAAPYFANKLLGSVNNFEGPHLYRKAGCYYLMLSHGGTSQNHAVSIWRSASPLGPWEDNPANPILTHRADHPAGIMCTGHADLIQTQTGEWWMTLLAVRSDNGRSPMGRETFLVPVDWSGTWPIVNPKGQTGRVYQEHARPNLPETLLSATPTKDEFSTDRLAPRWSMIRTPLDAWWDLRARPGWLRLNLRPEKLTELAQPTFLGSRLTAANSVATAKIDFNPTALECAGIAILRSRDACWLLVLEMKNGQRTASVYAQDTCAVSVPVSTAGPVELRIALANQELEFSVAEETGKFHAFARLPAGTLSTATGGRFTGTMVGPYASSRGQISKNHADFDWFACAETQKE